MDKSVAGEAQIHVQHGEPLRFGADNAKGLRFNAKAMRLEVVTVGEDGVSEDDIIVHDQTNLALAQMLAAMDRPDFPVAIGVIYDNPADVTYDQAVRAQNESAKAEAKITSIDQLLRSGATWQVD